MVWTPNLARGTNLMFPPLSQQVAVHVKPFQTLLVAVENISPGHLIQFGGEIPLPPGCLRLS